MGGPYVGLMTMELLCDLMVDGATMVRETLGPEDDWDLVGHFVSGEGVYVAPFHPLFFSNDETRREFFSLVAKIIKEKDIFMVGLIGTYWSADVNSVEDILTRPEDNPNRYEAVVVSVMDEERYLSRFARIERHPDAPPTLGEWEGGMSDVPAGVVVEEIQKALRERNEM
jgi:hypothetical protein